MQRPRIVLAEDHAEVAAQLRALLVAEFDVVAVVAGGQAVLGIVDADGPNVVVVTTIPSWRSAAIPRAPSVTSQLDGDRQSVRLPADGVRSHLLDPGDVRAVRGTDPDLQSP